MSAARQRELALTEPVGEDAWTFLQVLVWIRTQDERKALDHLEQVKADRALTESALKAVADYRGLKEALREGRIHCWAHRGRPRPQLYFAEDDDPETTGRREMIPAVEWLDRRIVQKLRGVFDALLTHRQPGVRAYLRPPLYYRDLRFSRAEIAAEWPPRSSTGAQTRPAMSSKDYEKLVDDIRTTNLSRPLQRAEMQKRFPNMRVKDFLRACGESPRSVGRRRKS